MGRAAAGSRASGFPLPSRRFPRSLARMSASAPRSALFAARVAEQPGNPLFRFSLGQALALENRPADAIPHLRLAADSRADWMTPRILLGKALANTGDLPAARAVLDEALALAVAQGHEDPEAELRALLAALPQ